MLLIYLIYISRLRYKSIFKGTPVFICITHFFMRVHALNQIERKCMTCKHNKTM